MPHLAGAEIGCRLDACSAGWVARPRKIAKSIQLLIYSMYPSNKYIQLPLLELFERVYLSVATSQAKKKNPNFGLLHP
jgi:hypothetical protein